VTNATIKNGKLPDWGCLCVGSIGMTFYSHHGSMMRQLKKIPFTGLINQY